MAQPYKTKGLKKVAGFYVDGIEICNIPIGKDDARGSPVMVFL